MDVQRIAILFGLGITAWLLLQAWNEDYGASGSGPIVETASATGIEGPENLAGAGDAIPELGTPAPRTTPDPAIPSLADTESGSGNAAVTPEAPSARVITVRTDVHTAQIDLRGGDLVSVSLPKYFISLENTGAFALVDPRNHFVAQSGLIGPDGTDGRTRPLFTTASEVYEMADAEQLQVDLVFQQSADVRLTKRYTFYRGNYLIDIDYIVQNNSRSPWSAAMFAQVKRDGQSPAESDSAGLGMQPYVGGAVYRDSEPYTKIEFDDLEDQPFKEKVIGGYAAMVQHYFVTAFVPVGEGENTYQAKKLAGQDRYTLGFTRPLESVAAGQTSHIGVQFYVGPKDQERLGEITKGLDLTVDYGFLWWLAQPLYYLLKTFHGFVGNWGFAIVLLTCTVKLLLYPLSAAGYRSMAKTRKLQPEMAKLKERFGDDKQGFSQAMMELYRKEKANPVGGCLPLMLQMPVFLALYWALMESVELRHAPFILWIHDLSAMDQYFVLPILFGVSMYLTTMMQPEPPDPMQAKVMKMMPVMFSFFFLWFPAGLVLYWLVNNLISILQQYYITRQLDKADPKAT